MNGITFFLIHHHPLAVKKLMPNKKKQRIQVSFRSGKPIDLRPMGLMNGQVRKKIAYKISRPLWCNQQTESSNRTVKMCLIEQNKEVKVNSKENPSQNSPPKSPTAAYAMFLHREELRRRKLHVSRVSVTKIHLTSELIAQTKQNIRQCSFEDLEILARETLFKKNLQRNLYYRRMHIHQLMISKKKQQAKDKKWKLKKLFSIRTAKVIFTIINIINLD